MASAGSAWGASLLVTLLVALIVPWALGTETDPIPDEYPVPPLRQFPRDECGPFWFQPHKGANFSGHSCPQATCKAERNACDDAKAWRSNCLRYLCNDLVWIHSYAQTACDAASRCVQKACYAVKPGNAGGQSCRVRSYFKGDCCCATCDDEVPTGTGTVRMYTQQCGNTGEMKPIDNYNPGLRLGQCVSLLSPVASQSDMPKCLNAYSGAWKAVNICLRQDESFAASGYKYFVRVDIAGPKDVKGSEFPGPWYLYFTDAFGWRHGVALNKTNAHYSYVVIPYNSKKPTITKIQWSTKPITK